MNILILNWRDITNPKSGGAEIVTQEHAKYWRKKGHNVTWFTSSYKGALNEEEIDGVRIVRRGNAVSVYGWAIPFYFKNKKKFDIIIDQIHGVPFFTPLYVSKPKIVFIHEVAGEIWNYMYPFPINILGKLLENFYFHLYKNEKFWTDAPSTINELKKHNISGKNCTAIPCPPFSKAVTNLPKKEKDITCIFVSRLVKMKGIEDVLKAFNLIELQAPNAKLWIVGAGKPDYVDTLKALTEKLEIKGKVKFFGRVDEEKKLNLMKRAHLLLHASVKEGWGLVVVEAASQGTPAVAYNVAGLRDSIQNGKTGVLTQKRNPENIAIESVKLFNDKKKYKKYQVACLEFAKSLRWEDATRKSMSIITSMYKKNTQRTSFDNV